MHGIRTELDLGMSDKLLQDLENKTDSARLASRITCRSTQTFGSESGLGSVRVGIRVFIEVVLLLDELVVVEVLVLVVVHIRPDEPTNI